LIDFRKVLVLDHSIVCARVNIGNVILQKLHEPLEAAKQFAIAIKTDPTYFRAYLCRAEAHFQLKLYKAASNDIARATHMNPGDYQLRVRRARVLHEMKEFELAKKCIKYIADMDTSDHKSSAAQKAIVQTFLENYDDAIDYMESICKTNPTTYIHVLLAKTMMKAKRYHEAIINFKLSLEIMNIFGSDSSNLEKLFPKRKCKKVGQYQAETFFLIGKCFQEMLNYTEAIEAYNLAIKADHEMEKAYNERGFCRLKLHRAKGVEDLNKSILLSKRNFNSFFLRAAYYSSEKKYSKAILNCNEALKIEPRSIKALMCRGCCKFYNNSTRLALEDLNRAVKIDPTCYLAFYNRAVCYQHSGKWHRAVQDYSTALLLMQESKTSSDINKSEDNMNKKIDTKSLDEDVKFIEMLKRKIHMNRAVLYLEDDHVDYRNAVFDLHQASNKNTSRDLALYFTRAVCKHRLFLLEEAIEDYDRCLQLCSNFMPAMLGKGDVFLDAHNVMAALNEYVNILLLDPTQIPARVHIGFCLQACGYYKEAWNHFTIAIKQASDQDSCSEAHTGRAISSLYLCNIDAAYNDIMIASNMANCKSARLFTLYGVIHQCSHNLRSALAMYKDAIDVDASFWPAYFNSGTVMLQSHRYAEAVELFDATLSLHNNHPASLVNRALSKIFLNDLYGAMDDFDEAIVHESESSHAFYNRGVLNVAIKNYKDAISDFTTALKLNPGDYVAMKRRADVYGMTGNKQRAIEDYQDALELYESKREYDLKT